MHSCCYALPVLLRLGVFVSVQVEVHAKRELAELSQTDADFAQLQTEVGDYRLAVPKADADFAQLQTSVNDHPGSTSRNMPFELFDGFPSLLRSYEVDTRLDSRQQNQALGEVPDDLDPSFNEYDFMTDDDRLAVKVAEEGELVKPEDLQLTCPDDTCRFFQACYVNTASRVFVCLWAPWFLIVTFGALAVSAVSLSTYVCFPMKEYEVCHLDEMSGKVFQIPKLSASQIEEQASKEKLLEAEQTGKQRLIEISEQRNAIAYQVKSLEDRIGDPKLKKAQATFRWNKLKRTRQFMKKQKIPEQEKGGDKEEEDKDAGPSWEELEKDAEVVVQAEAQALIHAVTPHLLFAKQCHRIVSEAQGRIFKKSADLIMKETNDVLFESVGIPENWSQGFEAFDVAPAMMVMMAGILAPLQLTLTWISQIIFFSFRISYVIATGVVLYMEFHKSCVHHKHTKDSIAGVKCWLLIDCGISITQAICLWPTMRLAHQAVYEIQRPESSYTNIKDPMQCFRESLLDDTLYSGFAVYRYDQICNARGVMFSRWISIFEFFWCLVALDKALDTPDGYCGAKWMLSFTKYRACIFIIFISLSIGSLLSSLLAEILDQSDSLFAAIMNATSDFDKKYSPGGLPLTSLLMRAFVARDSTSQGGADARVLRNELGYVKTEKSQEESQYNAMCTEAKDIDSQIEALALKFGDTLNRQQELQKKYEKDIQDFLHHMEDELGEDLITKLDKYDHDAVQKLRAMEEQAESLMHDLEADPDKVLKEGLTQLEQKVKEEEEWLMSKEGQEELARQAVSAKGKMVELEGQLEGMAMDTLKEHSDEIEAMKTKVTEAAAASLTPEQMALAQEQMALAQEQAAAAAENVKSQVATAVEGSHSSPGESGSPSASPADSAGARPGSQN